MRAPLSWIRDFTPVDASVDELVGALNQLGLEVDGVEEPGREIVGVRVARILDVLPHPNADRLRLADVDFGDGQTRVACGASNIAAGQLVPLAPAGATLPGGLRLERRKIRGEVSDGMLCSAKELGLGDDHEGILVLDELGDAAEPGTDLREALGLDDVVFDLAITPNRPDAMCIVGVARELAAHFRQPLEVPEPAPPADASVTSDVSVVIEAPDRCPRYVAQVATVTIGDAPAWMARRLVKAGMRPISNVVDVTNYVLLERNQPLHAFDLDRLPGRGVVVRTAEAGERITTLDGVERTLDATDLLICDAERAPEALAGIMGGSTSEVTDTTTSILLEAAFFEPMGIARSSKRLRLRSESSARFERGIDPDAVAISAARAMELLARVAGARVAPEVVDEHPRRRERPRITLRTSRVNAILGTALDDEEVLGALRPLGVDTEGAGDAIVAIAPPWRPDLTREIDLVEEVARRVGFEQIGRTVPDTHGQVGGLTARQRERRLVADALAGAGASEAITLSLVAPDDLARAGAPTDRLVEATNPLRAEESVLRTRILPGLLGAVAGNVTHGLPDVELFEVGRVFLAPVPGAGPLPEEPEHVAFVLAGRVRRRPIEEDRAVDVYDAVDLVRVVTDALGLAHARLERAVLPGLHPARGARLLVDGQEAGVVGELAPAVLDALGLERPVVAAELDLDVLRDATRRDRRLRAPSRFPVSRIDLAFVFADDVSAAAVIATIRAALGEVAEDVRCFDEFRAAGLGAGRRSLAFALTLRARERTLDDRELADLREQAIGAVAAAHQGELRT